MSFKDTGGGFKISERKIRECMNPACKKKFLSFHNGHRHCKKCSHREDNTGHFGDPHKVRL